MIKFLPLFFLFTSCQFFLSSIEEDDKILLKSPSEKVVKKTYCKNQKKSHRFTLISNQKSSQLSFIKFLKKHSKLNLYESMAAYTLLQMNLRPDLSAPTARVQFITMNAGKEKFYDIYSKDQDALPLFNGIEKLLEIGKSKLTIRKLINLLRNSPFLNNLEVDAEFSRFLNENKKNIMKNQDFSKLYIRGDESLKTNEKIPIANSGNIYTKYLRSKKNTNYLLNTKLFKYSKSKKLETKCNYDMGLYDLSVFLIHENFINSNIFGISDRKGNSIMAHTSQDISTIEPLEDTMFFKGSSNARTPAFCTFQNKLTKNILWLTSSKSRDPGQHLYHLLEYGLVDTNNIERLDSMLKFSRHLFLTNPLRLLFESDRGTKKQLEELLKLNFPIYNARSLGKIWGQFYSNKFSQQEFIIDDRSIGSISCI